jgi:acyl-CoA synthetase
VCIAVICREGEHVSGEGLLDHLHAVGLSKYDMPEYFIAMDAFPLTASGKVLKRELQEWVRIGRIAPQPVRWRETVKE